MSDKKTTIFSKPLTSQEEASSLYKYVGVRAKKTARDIYRQIFESPIDIGGILMVTGPVCCGKSTMILEFSSMLDREFLDKRRVGFAQPEVDRVDVPTKVIFSRDGKQMVCQSFGSKRDIVTLFHDHDVVVIDEIQFAPANLQSYLVQEIEMFVERGGWFVGMGLLYTSQMGQFLITRLMEELATKSYHLSSTCLMCGRPATKACQRLVDGKVAKIDEPELLSPSSHVTYEARCNECFVIKK